MKEKKKSKLHGYNDKQWEVNMNLTPEGNDEPKNAFLPRCGYKRPTMHVKTNECDY